MKFLKAYIGKTEKIKQIDNIVSKPVFYVSENEENETLTDAFIELDAPFKMITIFHQGYSNPLQSEYPGVSISALEGKTCITNISRVILTNDFLFTFGGEISSVTKVVVYGWGQNSIFAKITDADKMFPKNIDLDDNIISDDAIIMENKEYSETSSDHISNMDRNPNVEVSNNIVKGLYTNGNSFTFNRKRYKGYYHYNKDKKLYMTGATLTHKSVPLKKIRKFRRVK